MAGEEIVDVEVVFVGGPMNDKTMTMNSNVERVKYAVLPNGKAWLFSTICANELGVHKVGEYSWTGRLDAAEREIMEWEEC